MARNTVPIIIGAVLFGVLAIGLTFYSLLGGNNSAPTPTPEGGTATAQQPATGGVLIARRPIYPRTVITRDMIEESDSAATATPGAITNPYDVVGRLANRTIQAGQILTTDSVTNGLGRVIPANIAIPIGLRGVAVWVDPSQTAAGLVDVGDRVDVIATHELQMEKSGSQVIVGATQFTAGRTIAQDLEVLAVDRSITEMRPATPTPTPGQPAAADGAAAPQPGATPAPGQPGAAPAAPPAAPPPGQEQRTRVILAAAPEIAQRLVAANAQGKLHITIRNPVGRDRFPVVESREYPSRLAAAPGQRQNQDAPRSESEERREDAKLGLEVIKALSGRDQNAGGPPMPQPLPPFNPNAGTTVTTPMPAPEKDVTVIRGTEKTRVIVPR